MVVVIVAKHGRSGNSVSRGRRTFNAFKPFYNMSTILNGTAFHFETIPLSLLPFLATFSYPSICDDDSLLIEG